MLITLTHTWRHRKISQYLARFRPVICDSAYVPAWMRVKISTSMLICGNEATSAAVMSEMSIDASLVALANSACTSSPEYTTKYLHW
jgi:hypothetical protein